MAIGSSLTRKAGKTGAKKKPKFEWSSSELPVKGSSERDSDSESVQGSTTSSASSSLDRGTHKTKTPNPKKLTTFGSFVSSRRRAQSRLGQSPTEFSGDRSTTTENPSSVEASDESPDNLQRPTPKFTRTRSLRTVKLSRSKSKSKFGSKSRKSSAVKNSDVSVSDDLHLERATFSSTLKDSKFPEKLKAEAGKSESDEVLPVAKFCPYQHCSLHGRHHHHEPPKNRFVYLKRRTAKDPTSTDLESRTEKREVKATEAVSDRIEHDGGNSAARDDMGGGDFSIEFYAKTRSDPLVDATHGRHDANADLADILFGVNSFQDRNAADTPTSSLRSPIDMNDERNKNFDGSHTVAEKKPASKKVNRISMWHTIHRHMVSGLSIEPGDDPVHKAVEPRNMVSGLSIEPGDDPVHQAVEPQTEDSGSSVSSPQAKDFSDFDDDNCTNQETEIRKMIAIKLVREAIEKILLPEVQDDRSTTSEATVDPTVVDVSEHEKRANKDVETEPEKGTGDVSAQENRTEKRADKDVETEPEKGTGDVSARENRTAVETRAPSSWSRLKKVVLLRKFVKELKKVKRFSPKKPRHLPLPPEAESETVSLRRQTVDGRKNSDEWMLDYALQKVVSELAPTQKRKVSLLVKAFETVVPTTHEESPPTAAIRRAGSDDPHCVRESSFDSRAEFKDEAATGDPSEKAKRIEMWHMVYRHVVTDIATRVGSGLLLDGDESGNDEDDWSRRNYSDAVKLVRESVDEILRPEDTRSAASDIDELSDKNDPILEPQKSNNWSKLKKLVLVKRSIRALESFRNLQPPPPPQPGGREAAAEAEGVKLRSQTTEERKKAEQWMLDYAVRHILTKLTPARKKRVSMLVEAFEAVVPLPDT